MRQQRLKWFLFSEQMHMQRILLQLAMTLATLGALYGIAIKPYQTSYARVTLQSALLGDLTDLRHQLAVDYALSGHWPDYRQQPATGLNRHWSVNEAKTSQGDIIIRLNNKHNNRNSTLHYRQVKFTELQPVNRWLCGYQKAGIHEQVNNNQTQIDPELLSQYCRGSTH